LTSLTKKKNYINRTTHTNLFFSFKRPRNNILKRHNLCTRNGKIENTIKGQEIIYSNDTISVKKNGKIENTIKGQEIIYSNDTISVKKMARLKIK